MKTHEKFWGGRAQWGLGWEVRHIPAHPGPSWSSSSPTGTTLGHCPSRTALVKRSCTRRRCPGNANAGQDLLRVDAMSGHVSWLPHDTYLYKGKSTTVQVGSPWTKTRRLGHGISRGPDQPDGDEQNGMAEPGYLTLRSALRSTLANFPKLPGRCCLWISLPVPHLSTLGCYGRLTFPRESEWP